MPLYEYHCKDCLKTFEEFHPMKDSSKHQNCPHCGKPAERYYGTAPQFYFNDGPSTSIIDRSPMKDVNRGLPDDVRT